MFDDQVEVIHDRMPAQHVKELTEKEYYVRGMTALLDAVGSAIDHTVEVHKHTKPEFVPEKTLFVITTDGMENSSIEYSYEQVRRKIRHEQEKHGWEFIFLGANIDAVETAASIGIKKRNAVNFICDEIAMPKVMESVSVAMSSMRAGNAQVCENWAEEVHKDYKKRRR